MNNFENKMKNSSLAKNTFDQLSDEQKELVGKTFESLDMEEMEKLQGSGDTNGDTTFVTISSAACGAGISVVASYIISKVTK